MVLRNTHYITLNPDLSDEARCSLLYSDEATGRVSNAQVLDPAIEVSLVDWTLEVAARPVKARWVYLNAAAGGTFRSYQKRAGAYARWAGPCGTIQTNSLSGRASSLTCV